MKCFFKAGVVLAAAVSMQILFADEETDAQEVTSEAGTAQEDQKEQGGKAEKASDANLFHALPLCRLIEGTVQVLRTGAKDWEPAEEGRFYPFGCSYRTVSADSRLRLQFGGECSVEIAGDSAFGTLVQPVGLGTRAIMLQQGTVRVVLPRNIPAGKFKVTAPGFTAVTAGEAIFTYSGTGDGDVATVRCVTGELALEGRHFSIPKMRAANEVRIRTSQDILFTALYGTSGDYVVRLDQGVTRVKDFETGEEKAGPSTLDWQLSPQTAVRIHRARPSIGERLSVTVMTFDATGKLVNRCAFAEGLAEVNTGEQGEIALAAREETAKKAVASADAAATTTESAPEENASEENGETKKEESTEE